MSDQRRKGSAKILREMLVEKERRIRILEAENKRLKKYLNEEPALPDPDIGRPPDVDDREEC